MKLNYMKLEEVKAKEPEQEQPGTLQWEEHVHTKKFHIRVNYLCKTFSPYLVFWDQPAPLY